MRPSEQRPRVSSRLHDAVAELDGALVSVERLLAAAVADAPNRAPFDRVAEALASARQAAVELLLQTAPQRRC